MQCKAHYSLLLRCIRHLDRLPPSRFLLSMLALEKAQSVVMTHVAVVVDVAEVVLSSF